MFKNTFFRKVAISLIFLTSLVAVSVFYLSRPTQIKSAHGSAVNSYSLIGPSLSGITDVTQNGVIGDGVTDVTQALQNLVDTHKNMVLYFPTGTYIISDTINSKIDGSDTKSIKIWGQNQGSTIVKLKDNLPAYSTLVPKSMFYTDDGNTAFRNQFRNITINTGVGNNKAIGLDYITNNEGGLENVTVTSGDGSGYSGIEMTRGWFGPGSLENVTVNGFDYGLNVGSPHYSVTVEHLTLNNQNQFGIKNVSQILTIRDLKSNNSVPAIINCDCFRDSQPRSLVTLIDSELRGGGASASAFINEKNNEYFLRNVISDGYNVILNDNGVMTSGNYISEKTHRAPLSLFGDNKTSLNLPIRETPSPDLGDAASWVKVNGGAFDDAVAIQAAINSGAQTIYLPQATYYIRNAIIIDHPINIIGFGASIKPTSDASYFFNAENGVEKQVVKITGTGSGMVYMQDVAFDNTASNGYITPNQITSTFNHVSSLDLVLKNVSAGFNTGWSYKGSIGAGDAYFENLVSGPIYLAKNQNVWARQFNVEGHGNGRAHLVNDGGKAWIFDMKTENKNQIIENINGGQLEVLGSNFYSNLDTPLGIVNTDSDISINYATNYYNKPTDFDVHMRDTENGVTKELKFADLPYRSNGKYMPLYVNRRSQLTSSSASSSIVSSNSSSSTSSTPISSSSSSSSNDLPHVFLKANLSGAYNAATHSMNTTLRNNGLLPLGQPFNQAPWSVSSNVSVNDINTNSQYSNIVDWVLVEIRDENNNLETAIPSLINSDGRISLMPMRAGTKHNFVIKHRNHIAISTATFVTIAGSSSDNMTIDFATNQNVKGNNQRQLLPGIYGMLNGDLNNDGGIDATDRNELRNKAEVDGVYSNYDLNMDGGIDATDRNIIRNTPEGSEVL